MEDILRDYHVSPATWFYLSFLLIVAVYFRFRRFWSVRNLDLVLLLLLSPGLLFVQTQEATVAVLESSVAPLEATSQQLQSAQTKLALGYGWLFVFTAVLLLRLFSDGLFTRRPRLEQNLNVPGLAFLGVAAFVFLMTKALTEDLPAATVRTTISAEKLLAREDVSTQPPEVDEVEAGPGPTTPLMTTPVVALLPGEEIAPRIMAIVAHLAVVVALIVLGRVHFGELQLGLAMATLYLLLPCTAEEVGKVNHVLPAALILWALAAYRRPMIAGSLMGLACGSLFFPVFLLPLWAVFYDRRGALRFCLALCLVGVVLAGSLMLTSADAHSFTRQIIGSIDWPALQFQGGGVAGFWSTHDAAYRIPVFVAFLVMLVVLTIWPRQKTLEHLIAHSAAIVVATQFWYPQRGGVYLLWYLPLLLLVVFRPRLSHHVPPAAQETLTTLGREPRPARKHVAARAASKGPLFR